MPCWSGELRVLFHVNDEILSRLKQPFGQLVSGPPKNTIPKLREIIHNEKPKKLIAVGDVVARNMQKAGLPVDLVVVDGKTMRCRKIEFADQEHTLIARNPPGQVTQEAVDALKIAMRGNVFKRVFVIGEEDLLTLPLIALAPAGSIIVYGQPLEGLVIVRVNSLAKREARSILSRMSTKFLEKG